MSSFPNAASVASTSPRAASGVEQVGDVRLGADVFRRELPCTLMDSVSGAGHHHRWQASSRADAKPMPISLLDPVTRPPGP